MKDTVGFKVIYDWIFKNHGGLPATIEKNVLDHYSDLIEKINALGQKATTAPPIVNKAEPEPKTPKQEIAQALELLNKNVKEADIKAAIAALAAKVK